MKKLVEIKKTGISEKVIEEICRLAVRYNISRIRLFGSRARGDFYKTSDIDLAAEGGNIAEFSIDVDEDTSTLLKYDIVNLDTYVQPELRDAIEKEGIVIYEKI